MDRRLGWEVERVILALIIAMGLADFAGLLTPFWAYLMDVIGWTLISYIIYAMSPTELFFGERHAHADLFIVLSFVTMSVKDLVGNAAATLPELVRMGPDIIRFTPVNATPDLSIAVSQEYFNAYNALSIVPDAVVQAVAPHLTMAKQQVVVLMVGASQQVTLQAFPIKVNGAMLMFYNTLVANAPAIQTISLLSGAVLLLLASIYAAWRIPVRKPSILSVFKEEGPATPMRFIWVFLLFLGFFVIVFNLLFEWMTITNDAPLIFLAVITLGTLFLFHHLHLSKDEMLEKLGSIGDDLYIKTVHLFMDGRTILLGISGFLVLHLLTDVGNFVAPSIFGWYETIYIRIGSGDHTPIYEMIQGSLTGVPLQDTMTVIAYILSTLGIITLLTLPAVIWYKIFKIRSTGSHEHLPDWKGWQVGIVLACIAVFIIIPVFDFTSFKGGELVGVNLTSLPIGAERLGLVPLALGIAAGIFLLCAIIGAMSDYGRRLLMLGPFGAAAVFFGIYVYHYFTSSFVYYATLLVTLIQDGSYALVPFLFIIFGFTILFFISGFISFLYEIWRD